MQPSAPIGQAADHNLWAVALLASRHVTRGLAAFAQFSYGGF